MVSHGSRRLCNSWVSSGVEESATSAIDKLNGTPLKGKQVYVGSYLCTILTNTGHMPLYPLMLPRGHRCNIPFKDTLFSQPMQTEALTYALTNAKLEH
ncbi:hypothetical protein Q3G72_020363 [Acer saccharum]|nr:hypothetical protein Q3G72_020363 [Acer saccharum]